MGVPGTETKPNPDATSSILTGGTNSELVSYTLIFWNEISQMGNAVSPVTLSAGKVTEVLGGGKYKVNVKGSVITAVSSVESMSALFPWQTAKSNILKGALVLLYKNGSGINAEYTVISYRQTGVYAPKEASEYEV